MAKLVKLSQPLPTGEEWALVLTHDDTERLRSLLGGCEAAGILHETFVVMQETVPFGESKYKVSGTPIKLTRI